MDKQIPTPLCTRDAWEELKTKPDVIIRIESQRTVSRVVALVSASSLVPPVNGLVFLAGLGRFD
jgi:hypothetical protein